MRLNKACEIEKCVSADKSRAVLGYVRIGALTVPEGKASAHGKPGEVWAVACDGRILALVPVELEDEETIEPTLLTADQAKRVRKAKLPYGVGLNGKLDWRNGAVEPVVKDGQDMVYPTVNQIIPDAGRKVAFAVSFDAELLARLQRAMGAGGVRLEFEDEISPIRVLPQGKGHAIGALGVLMPMRMT